MSSLEEERDLDASIKETLDEIAAEGGEIANDPRPKPEAPKPEEPKVEEQPKVDPEKKEEPKEPVKQPKVPTVMPRYEHAIAEKRWEKERDELIEKHKAELEEARKQVSDAKTPAEIKQASDDFEALAAEIGADPVAVEKIVKAARAGYQIPAEVQKLLERLPELDRYASENKEREAEAQFIQEFDKEVRSLVEAEYGSVSAEQLRDIREKLKEKVISDPRLVTAPLSLIYSGDDSFRGVVKTPTQTAEKTRSGGSRQETVDFENMTDEKFDQLTDEQQDAYAAYQASKKK